MRRLLWLLAAFALSVPVWANEKIQGSCEQGGYQVNVPSAGGQSQTNAGVSTFWQQSFTSCTVTVYVSGTLTLATIYSNNTGTSLGNPFTSDATGHWFFYAANGRYDVNFSGGNAPIASPFTYGDYLAFDPAVNTTSGLALGNESSSVTVNAALYSFWTMTLVGNVTVVDITNPTLWQQVGFDICQNGTGGFSLTWGSQFSNVPVLPNVDVAANSCTIAYFIYTGSSWQYRNVNTGCSLTTAGGIACAATGSNQNIVLTPSGTGFVSSPAYIEGPVLDAGGAVYNVKNSLYGATGNGLTNDTTGILAAMTASCNENPAGGTIVFPPGTYLHTQIAIPCGNLILRGAGVSATHLKDTTSGSTTFGIWASNENNIIIKDMEIDGNSAGTAGNSCALVFGNVQNGWLINSYVHDGENCNWGIDINSSGSGGSTGINGIGDVFGPTHSASGPANIEIGNGLVSHVLLSNIKMTEGTNVSNIGIDVNGASYVTLSNVQVDGTSASSGAFSCVQLETGSGSGSGSGTQYVAINGGSLSHCITGLWLGTGGQTGRPLQHVAASGIAVANNGTGVAFNTLNGSSGSALTDINVSGNTISNSTGAGILFSNSAGATFTGVVAQNNTINGYGATCTGGTADAGIAECGVGWNIAGGLLRGNTVVGSGYGFQNVNTSQPQGGLLLRDNNFADNASGEVTGNGPIFDTADLHFSFTPTSGSGAGSCATYSFPYAPATYLLNIESFVTNGGGTAYANSQRTDLVWVHNTNAAMIASVVTNLSAMTANITTTLSFTDTGEDNNAVQICATNSSVNYAPVYVTARVLGYNAVPGL